MEKIEEIQNENFSSRSLNKKITDIISKNRFNLNNSYDIQKELLFFKNEILKDMRNLESKQTEKLIDYREKQIKLLNSYEVKISEQNEKITYLSNMITDYFRKDKFEIYFEEFTKKQEKNFAEMASKIYSLQDNIKDVLYKQEKFFNENVLYPGIIGYQCKFKDFHAFVDFVLESIHRIESYQEILKSYELHKIKKSIETDLNLIQSQIKTNFDVLSKFTTEKVKENEEKILKVLDDYNTQFVDVRIENNTSANNLKKKMEEVAQNYEQIIKIRKEMNMKNEEQDKKLEDIIHNIADNENKIIEQNKEINNVDKKFNLLTTFIDNQNEENDNLFNSFNSGKFSNNKFVNSRRIQSAKDFIDRQLKLIAREEEKYGKEESNKILYNTNITYGYNNKFVSNKNNYNNIKKNNFRTINNSIPQRKSFVFNKKLVIKGDSFIKRYITGKIGIDEMYNHPKNQKDKNKANRFQNETSPSRKIQNFSPIEDKSKIFNLTKLRSNEDKKEKKYNDFLNYKKNKPKNLNINNNNFQNNRFITKSLSDGNYNYPNTRLMNHENFMEEINNILTRRHRNIQIISPINDNYQKTSYNRFIQQQLIKDKKLNNVLPKKRKKLLIIQ